MQDICFLLPGILDTIQITSRDTEDFVLLLEILDIYEN